MKPIFLRAPAPGQRVDIRIDEMFLAAINENPHPTNRYMAARIREFLDGGYDTVPGRWSEELWLQTPDVSDHHAMVQLVGADDDVSVVSLALTGDSFEPVDVPARRIVGLEPVEPLIAGPVFNQQGRQLNLNAYLSGEDREPLWSR
jgi:hypothetical protein